MAEKSTVRIAWIDGLRGIAALLMLNQHLGIWLWREQYRLFKDPFMLALNGLGGLAAPLFITLAGTGTVLLARRHRNPDRTCMLRGLCIMAFGYLLNLLTPGWFSAGSWYVLHMIGFALVLAPLLRRMPDSGLLLGLLLVLGVTVVLQNWLETPLRLSNTRMGNMKLDGGVFRLALAEGHFPVFPWLAFFMAGMLGGRWFMQKKFRFMVFLGSACLAGAGLLSACSYLKFDFAVSDPLIRACRLLPRFYPSLLPMSLLLLGLSLMAVYCCSTKGLGRLFSPSNPLVSLGRVSLTVLVVHVIVFRELSRVFGFFRVFSKYETLLLLAGLLAGFLLLAAWWKKADYRLSLEWVMRKITG